MDERLFHALLIEQALVGAQCLVGRGDDLIGVELAGISITT